MSNWRNTSAYRNWRKACIERDGGKCTVTGSAKNLQVHHLNHATYFIEERFDVDNGVTVHRLIHLLFHIFMMGGYRKKCTKKDWDRFIRLFKYIKMVSKLIS